MKKYSHLLFVVAAALLFSTVAGSNATAQCDCPPGCVKVVKIKRFKNKTSEAANDMHFSVYQKEKGVSICGMCVEILGDTKGMSVSDSSLSQGDFHNDGENHQGDYDMAGGGVAMAVDDDLIIADHPVDEECPTADCSNMELTDEYMQVIPTLSEWGMILLVLLLLAAGSVAVVRRQTVGVNNSGTVTMNASHRAPVFEGKLFTQMSLMLLPVAVAGLFVAVWLFGSVTTLDTVGTLISSLVIAYIIHLWLLQGKGK